MSDPGIVVIGAGQAGGWAAKTLRDEGFEGRIVVVGEEPYPPYERPPLSKEVLLGKEPAESSYLWPEGSFDLWGVELRTGVAATGIDRTAKTVSLGDGESLAYDKLLIATGGRVRELPLEGAALDGVHYLRGIDDSAAIRADLGEGARLVVIGGGWIGLEVAAAARMLGAEVAVVEALGMLCARALTPEIAAYLLRVHRGRGVDVRLGAIVEALTGDGRVTGVRLACETLAATAVVIGIGIVPNVELAESAGLEVDNGIRVDALCRTSDPDIFAAGDVTN
ncbi:MAG: NAD(P)/FAD-dependent oxidoreductase, partial [Defluviicoccus sp.]|nr:NAD(P)/FAD-dependent oxidoreductase [Defluviicoccus sp.]